MQVLETLQRSPDCCGYSGNPPGMFKDLDKFYTLTDPFSSLGFVGPAARPASPGKWRRLLSLAKTRNCGDGAGDQLLNLASTGYRVKGGHTEKTEGETCLSEERLGFSGTSTSFHPFNVSFQLSWQLSDRYDSGVSVAQCANEVVMKSEVIWCLL